MAASNLERSERSASNPSSPTPEEPAAAHVLPSSTVPTEAQNQGHDSTYFPPIEQVNTATSTISPSLKKSKTRSSPLAPLRRQRTNERIQEILENAMERQVTNQTFPDLAHEVDETTSIITRTRTGPEVGYQTANAPLQGDEQWRRSIYATGAASSNHAASMHARSYGTLRPTTSQDPTSTAPEGNEADVSGGQNRRDNRSASTRQSRVGWLRNTLSLFRSTELENKGSVARDHLAIERTFLAWLRTSLAFASIGVAITQLFRLNTSLGSHSDKQTAQQFIVDGTTLGARDDVHDLKLDRVRSLGKPLGSAFLAISILILLLGYHRYTLSTQWVIKGKFPASRLTVVLVALVTFGLMVTSLVVVIAVQPS